MPSTKTRTEAPSDTIQSMRGASAADDMPRPVAELSAMVAEAAAEARIGTPALTPPAEVQAEEEAADAGITAWHNGKKVTAMWAEKNNRNTYASVEGQGWKRICNDNDSAFLSLTMLASHAETTGSNVNVQIDATGEIKEMYVW